MDVKGWCKFGTMWPVLVFGASWVNGSSAVWVDAAVVLLATMMLIPGFAGCLLVQGVFVVKK